MQAVIREYMGTVERDRYALPLEPIPGVITLGRSEGCTYRLGKSLGHLAMGISKVQATITLQGNDIFLRDGGTEGASTNGIYCHAEKVNGSVALVPGMELTLFKQGIAKVTLIVSDSQGSSQGSDTYTGHEVLAQLQGQMEALAAQTSAVHEQVELLDGQLKQREAIDAKQEERLKQTEKRLNRVLAAVFGVIALIVLASGWSGGTLEDRKQWSSTLTAISIGIAAAYFKSKENEGLKAKG
jgi:pSer/pThr/pTyr-binding forkhead associated (FHA) protein